MNFFERKERYKSGSGQNPLPTPEQMDQYLAKFSIGIDWGKDVMDGRIRMVLRFMMGML